MSSDNYHQQPAFKALRNWRSPLSAKLRPDWYVSLWREQRTLLLLIATGGCLAYGLFVLADSVMYPENSGISLRIRLPAALATLGLLAWIYYRVQDAQQWDRLTLPAVVLLALLSLYPILTYPGQVSSGYFNSSLSYIAMLSLLTQTHFRWMLAGTLLIAAAVLAVMIHTQPNVSMVLLEFASTFVPICLFCLLVCWSRLLASRRAYLRLTLSRFRLQALDHTNYALRTQADTDVLTGIGNRRAFEAALRKQLGQQAALEQGFALLLIDVDHFKPYNDHYGHQAGDECLQHVAHALHEALPDSASGLFRIGGEEFSVLANITDNDALLHLCNRLVDAIGGLKIRHDNRPDELPFVSISVGACLVPAHYASTRKLLLTQADYHLYQAKKNGRNQAVTGIAT